MAVKFINYAHRGASAYLPENTMEAFSMGLTMGANGIETDVRRTKDGVLVLFHDETPERMTGQPGKISDYTYAELQDMDVCNYGLKGKIPRLEEFLEVYAGKDVQLAVELKQDFTEAATIDLLERYGMRDRTILTSFKLECLMRAKNHAPEYPLGYLTDDIHPLMLQVMGTIGVQQICPKGKLVTPELVEDLHRQGYSVRAWGIKNEERMRQVFDAGADGMTVNFPDKLTAYLQEH